MYNNKPWHLDVRRRGVAVCASISVLLIAGALGCAPEAEPPVATPTVLMSKQRLPLGSLVEMTYRFTVAPEIQPVEGQYRVLVHFLDSEQELMWTDDHTPPTPVGEWQPSERIEYTRTIFLPIYPYVGMGSVAVGLYDADSGRRLPLAGEDLDQRSYNVATIELLPQSENVFVIFKDGWHLSEVLPENPTIEWQWTKKNATLAFQNPRVDSTLYLQYAGRPDLFDSPQQMTIAIGGQAVDTVAVESGEQVIRQIHLTADQLGSADMVELHIQLDRVFVPVELPGTDSTDDRELGIRVFHAYVEPSATM